MSEKMYEYVSGELTMYNPNNEKVYQLKVGDQLTVLGSLNQTGLRTADMVPTSIVRFQGEVYWIRDWKLMEHFKVIWV